MISEWFIKFRHKKRKRYDKKLGNSALFEYSVNLKK